MEQEGQEQQQQQQPVERGEDEGEMGQGELKEEIGRMMRVVQQKMDERQHTLLAMQDRLRQLQYARDQDARECATQMIHLRTTITKLTNMVEIAHQQQLISTAPHQQQQQQIPVAQQPPWHQPQQPPVQPSFPPPQQQMPQQQQIPMPQQPQVQQQIPQQPQQFTPSSLTTAKRVCHNCGGTSPTMSLCGGCRKVTFCDRKCQLEAWPNHRMECQAQQ